ncbi:DUF2877 domain-containing protein [Nitrospinota bacterium]
MPITPESVPRSAAPPARRFPIVLMGGGARRALGLAAENGRETEGRVLAVFRRSFYLEMKGLVCIGPPALGAGPLNAVCALPNGIDWGADGLRPGERARRAGASLTVGGRFAFSASGAQVWRPPPPPRERRPETLSRALAALAEEAARRGPAEGFAPLIPDFVGESPGPGGMKTGPFLRAAARGSAALIRWLENAAEGGEVPAPPEEAEILIGLGPGLTPSGDDFIGGAMVALWALGLDSLAERLAGWALPLAGKRTGLISRAHLECAAKGEGAGALHEAIAAMCGPSGADVAGCVDALGAIGHTSGWDALAGVSAVCGIARAYFSDRL